MMLHQQDQALDSISGTLTNLAQQAGLIGQEVDEHNTCVPSRFVDMWLRLYGCPCIDDRYYVGSCTI